MTFATLILILFLYGVVVYFVYQNAVMRFDKRYRRFNDRVKRQIERQDNNFSSLQSEFAELRSAAASSKQTDGDNKKTPPQSLNPLINMEERHVQQVKDNEVIIVGGKPVRKNTVFK